MLLFNQRKSKKRKDKDFNLDISGLSGLSIHKSLYFCMRLIFFLIFCKLCQHDTCMNTKNDLIPYLDSIKMLFYVLEIHCDVFL